MSEEQQSRTNKRLSAARSLVSSSTAAFNAGIFSLIGAPSLAVGFIYFASAFSGAVGAVDALELRKPTENPDGQEPPTSLEEARKHHLKARFVEGMGYIGIIANTAVTLISIAEHKPLVAAVAALSVGTAVVGSILNSRSKHEIRENIARLQRNTAEIPAAVPAAPRLEA